jgi:multidrug efflux pump subunit AcrA (membrane-fusion protein)
VYGGQPALIRIGAFPNRVFRGHVREVAPVASQLDSPSRDIRVYRAEVALDESCEGVRLNMSAEVTILEDETRAPVLALPVPALVHSPERGHRCTCYVLTPEGPEERDVVVGRHTEEKAEVQTGLCEGEEVVLNPEVLVNEKARTDAAEAAVVGTR